MGMVGSASPTDPKNLAWDPDVLVSLLFLGHILGSSSYNFVRKKRKTLSLSQVVSFLDNNEGA